MRTRSASNTLGCLIRLASLGKQRIWRAGSFDAMRLNSASNSKKPLSLGTTGTVLSLLKNRVAPHALTLTCAGSARGFPLRRGKATSTVTFKGDPWDATLVL